MDPWLVLWFGVTYKNTKFRAAGIYYRFVLCNNGGMEIGWVKVYAKTIGSDLVLKEFICTFTNLAS